MSDVTPAPAPVSGAAHSRSSTRRPFWRWTRRLMAVLTAVLAALVVAGLSLDLGPAVRTRVEQAGKNYLERPMHVGKVSALLRPGEFRLDDVVIEGLTPDARPFLRAKHLLFQVTWWTLISRQLTVEVRMTDWEMVVETFPGTPASNVPKLKPRNPSTGPKWYSPKVTRVSYVYADSGAFTYDDHVTPWHVSAPNLAVDLAWANPLGAYVGTARFSNGVVQIQNYLPMRADLTARFDLNGSVVHLPSIDLVTDGAHSRVRGEVDFSKWPEQRYLVDSIVDFPRMREIFFANQTWRLSGQGHFQGIFHLFKGGRELRGDFTSEVAGVGDYRFPNLKGSLAWLPGRFEVTNAEADLYGGRAKFDYTLDPLGTPQPANASFNVDYTDVDLETLGRELDWRPLRLKGRATGHNAMRWPNGHASTGMHGEGNAVVTPPAGAPLAPAVLPATFAGAVPAGPFDKSVSISPLPIGGQVAYRFDNDWIDVDEGSAATAATYVSFHGRSAYTDKANIAFHVTSADWQESDRVLVGLMREFGASASPIEVGGHGTFDGALTGKFTQPRVEGTFAGDAVRAWGVTWGRALASLVIENHYVDVTHGVIGDAAPAQIFADGRFSLGYPRADAGEEIHARVQVNHWPLDDFRTAFGLRDWPVDGIASADVTLTGPYERPFGSGTLQVDNGVAWRETFERATGVMQFEGIGLNINRIVMTKGPGLIHGAMWIGWDKTYSFDSDGDHIPVESLTRFTIPQAPLSGVLKFTASGTGAFASPTYSFQGGVVDLFAGDEGIGQLTGKLTVKNNVVAIDYLEAASARLQMSGSGNIALNEAYDADLTFRFSDTSIDPYLKFIKFVEPQVSPFLRAIASGSVRIAGELANPSALLVDATLDDAKLTLLDYDLHNDGKIHVTFDQNVVGIHQLKLAGNGTSLDVRGDIPLGHAPMSVTANGDVSLAILQGLGSFKYVSSSGTATLSARLEGDAASPVFSGYATIENGRIRHNSLPRSLENINGRIAFDTLGINVDQLHAQMGGGDVDFGGSISLKGYVPNEFNLNATGKQMRLRYPVGFETTVDAELQLRGPVATPTLSGTVDVVRSTFTKPFETDLSVLLGGGGVADLGAVGTAEPAFPMTFEIQIHAPPILFIDSRDAKIYGHIDSLVYRGTIDKPVLSGRIDIDRGEAFLAGNRYNVTRGAIDFSNPAKIEPFFDIEAETRVRASSTGQTYNVAVRVTGSTLERLTPTITSDPPLPLYDILSLLLGESPDVGTAEQRALKSPQEAQAQALRTFAAQLLTAPLSSRVGSVFEKTVPLDTVQIVPLLGNQEALQSLTPGARVTLGKRISSRAFLTYSRTLNQQQFEVYVLEYEQNERVSWVLSRNEDHTFALDFRIRHVF